MTQKKRSSKRRPLAKPEQDNSILEITEALNALPLPARAIVNEHIKDLDKFRQRYPRLYNVMFKDADSKHYRAFERHLERVQEQKRGRA
jgi:hypothetical protein